MWNSGFLRALRGTEQSWNLWQLTDRFSVPGSRMKLCELHTEHTETERQWRPAATRKWESNHLCLFLSLRISPSLRVSPSVSSCSVSLSVSTLSSSRARGAVRKRMSPPSQCYLGEIDSLASVLSAAICWCFHIPEKWGEGVVKTAKVRITTLASTGEKRERPLLSHHERC